MRPWEAKLKHLFIWAQGFGFDVRLKRAKLLPCFSNFGDLVSWFRECISSRSFER